MDKKIEITRHSFICVHSVRFIYSAQRDQLSIRYRKKKEAEALLDALTCNTQISIDATDKPNYAIFEKVHVLQRPFRSGLCERRKKRST